MHRKEAYVLSIDRIPLLSLLTVSYELSEFEVGDGMGGITPLEEIMFILNFFFLFICLQKE